MYSVLIADDNEQWLNILDACISRIKNYRVTARAYNGKEAIELIEKHRPDAIVLDIIMPIYDGVYIVNYIREQMEDYDPIIYILSGIGTDTIIKVLNELNIDFYSMKPVDLELFTDKLVEITQRHFFDKEFKNEMTAEQERIISDKIKDVVFGLGIPPHLKPNRYARAALMFYYNNPDQSRQLTTVFYPAIAKEFHTTSAIVERNIRRAVSQMLNAKTALYKQIFSVQASDSITNSEFLSVVVNYISQ